MNDNLSDLYADYIDDSISEKPPTDENDIICRHYDHCSGRSVKGISFMTELYHSQNVTLPDTVPKK